MKVYGKSILAFNFLYEQKKIGKMLTMDHFSGTCMILFKGDFEDCKKVRAFIEELKGL